MKNVVITGGTGFLGKALCKQFADNEYKVIALSSKDYDLRSEDQTINMYETEKPDILIHLAATVGGIGINKKHPGLFIEENLSMGLNVIKVGKEKKIEKLVMMGTVCSYPKHCPVPFKEEELWNGYPEETNAPYGIAKKVLMQLVQSYHQEHGFNGLNLIPVNMYGPNDNFDTNSSHVIPALILKFYNAMKNIKHDDVEVWGSGNASREFLYIDDCAKAIKLAVLHHNEPHPINLGTGIEITIKDLALKIQDIMGHKGKIYFNSSFPDGQPRRCLDVSKATESFGFKAETDFTKGLKETIEWFLGEKQ